MTKKFKIVQPGTVRPLDSAAEEALSDLTKEGAELVKVKCDTEEEMIEATKDADIIMFSRVNITRRILESSPKCQAVLCGSVGYNQIDVDAATENHIIVVNHPAAVWCVEEVSNHAILLLLACAKKLAFLNDYTKQGRWAEAKAAQQPMVCIHGQTLGLVGCGSIGRMTAEKAQCFSLKIIGYDPYLDKAVAEKSGITLMSLPEVLKQSDFISVHTPLLDSTYHLLSRKEFEMMKPSAYIVNTARGPIIDEPALIKALEEKKIAGAGLDVFEKEPVDPDNALLKMENVVVAPHSASYSDVAMGKPGAYCLRQALRIMRGQWPEYPVNASVKPKVGLKKEPF